MTKQITLEEALKLVSFSYGDFGWQVREVRGDVEGNVRGDVRGNVNGYVYGNVRGDVDG